MSGDPSIQDAEQAEGAEQRRHIRKRVLWAARLETDQGPIRCIILNVSRSGAKLRLTTPASFAPHQLVELVLESHGTLPAEIIWQREDRMGIHFRADPTQVANIIGSSLAL